MRETANGFAGGGRINDDMGGRGGSPSDFAASATAAQRGGTGAEQGVTSSAIAGNPHSSAGFRRALMKTQSGSNRLKNQLPNGKTFAGKGYAKPNYFAQGGGRHGMHIGSGAPFTGPATGDSGAGFGGE